MCVPHLNTLLQFKFKDTYSNTLRVEDLSPLLRLSLWTTQLNIL